MPIVMPGFSDSHWFRKAFKSSVVYGFHPRRELDLFTAPRSCTGPTSAPPSPTSSSRRRSTNGSRGVPRCARRLARRGPATRRNGPAQRPARPRTDLLGDRRARSRRRPRGGFGTEADAGPRPPRHDPVPARPATPRRGAPRECRSRASACRPLVSRSRIHGCSAPPSRRRLRAPPPARWHGGTPAARRSSPRSGCSRRWPPSATATSRRPRAEHKAIGARIRRPRGGRAEGAPSAAART